MSYLRLRTFIVTLSLVLLTGFPAVPIEQAKADFASSSWGNVSSPVNRSLYTVWGSGAGNVYAAGDGVMLKYGGSSWSVVPNRCYNYRSIAGASASDIAAVGMGGPLESFNGTSWSAAGPLAGNQYDLASVGSRSYVGVGDSWGGQPGAASTPVTRMQNGTWNLTPSSSTLLQEGWTFKTTFNTVWSASANDIWAAGINEARNGPIFYHWDGSIWNSSYTTADGSPAVTGMWGSSASDIWAVAGDSTNGGRRDIYHYDGTSWTRTASYSLGADGPKGQAPTAVWGTSASDVWIIGENAQGSSFMHYDGTSWGMVGGPAQNATATFRSMWGSSATDVWAVGDGGNIIHFGSTPAPSGSLTDTYDCTGQRNPQPPAPTVEYSASSQQVTRPGASVQVNWRSTNADTVSIDGTAVTPAGGGNRSYFIPADHTFTIKACATATARCDTKTLTITTVSGITATLSANPSTAILPVASTTLSATATPSDPGNLTYTFYCDRSDSGTNVTTPFDAQTTNVSALTQSTSACKYASAGTYTAKLIVQQGSIATEVRTLVSRVAPSVQVNISADSNNSGALPFTPTLTVNVGGNLTGPIIYTYYCDQSTTSTVITSPNDGQVTSSATTQTFKGCTYTKAGFYSAKVIVQQAGHSAQSQVGISPAGLDVRFAMSPNMPVPLNGITLSAQVYNGSSGSGLIDYYFWCTAQPGQSVTSGDDDYHLLQTSNFTVSSPVKCNYPGSQGQAKVIVVRAGATVTQVYTLYAQPSELLLTMTLAPNTNLFKTGDSVTMVADIDGTADGDTTVYFYCNTQQQGTIPLPGYETPPYVSSLKKFQVTYTCTYPQNGNMRLKIIATRGTAPSQTQRALITVADPIVTGLGFGVSPASGQAPISGSTLHIDAIGGTAVGSLDYYFYCDNPDTSTDFTTIPPDWTALNQAGPPAGHRPLTSPVGLCDSYYTISGTYHPKVIIQRGGPNGAIVSVPLTITYGGVISQLPTVSLLVNGVSNPVVQLGQALNFTWTTTDVTKVLSSSSNWSLPGNPPVNCPIDCGAATVANQIGDQVYSISVSGPLGVVKSDVVVKVTAKATNSAQIDYNYSIGN